MRKGQGATEYLVILGVVLIVALVVIGLLGWFPGLGGATQEQQSAAYWQGTTPFAVKAFKLSGTSVSMTLQNQLSEQLTLTEIFLTNDDLGVADTVFQGGEQKTITGTLGATCGSSGARFNYTMVLQYNQAGITGINQTGAKELIGKCT